MHPSPLLWNDVPLILIQPCPSIELFDGSSLDSWRKCLKDRGFLLFRRHINLRYILLSRRQCWLKKWVSLCPSCLYLLPLLCVILRHSSYWTKPIRTCHSQPLLQAEQGLLSLPPLPHLLHLVNPVLGRRWLNPHLRTHIRVRIREHGQPLRHVPHPSLPPRHRQAGSGLRLHALDGEPRQRTRERHLVLGVNERHKVPDDAGADEAVARGRRAGEAVRVGADLLERLDDVKLVGERASGEVGMEGGGPTQVRDVAQEDVDDRVHRGAVRAVEPRGLQRLRHCGTRHRPPEVVPAAAGSAHIPAASPPRHVFQALMPPTRRAARVTDPDGARVQIPLTAPPPDLNRLSHAQQRIESSSPSSLSLPAGGLGDSSWNALAPSWPGG
uniref:Uncharacterized protein n=1 Tax=Zea mays TaxID=4577 RepID=C0HH99_MAIZE|nr:unknown [Zea mays]